MMMWCCYGWRRVSHRRLDLEDPSLPLSLDRMQPLDHRRRLIVWHTTTALMWCDARGCSSVCVNHPCGWSSGCVVSCV